MSDLDVIISHYERTKNSPLPKNIFKTLAIIKIGEHLQNRNNLGLYYIYKNIEKYQSLEPIRHLEKDLQRRKAVNEYDTKLIQNIVEALKDAKKDFVLDSIGNYLQIAELLDEIKTKGMKRKVKVALIFWLYITIFETITSYFSEIFLMIAKQHKEEKKYSIFLEEYNDEKQKGQHLTAGALHNYAVSWGLCDAGDENFLKRRNYRNKIGHANAFYDSVTKKIIMRNEKELTYREFFSEFMKMKDFLSTFIFLLNDGSTSLIPSIKNYSRDMSSFFMRMERNPPLKKRFKEIDFKKELD